MARNTGSARIERELPQLIEHAFLYTADAFQRIPSPCEREGKAGKSITLRASRCTRSNAYQAHVEEKEKQGNVYLCGPVAPDVTEKEKQKLCRTFIVQSNLPFCSSRVGQPAAGHGYGSGSAAEFFADPRVPASTRENSTDTAEYAFRERAEDEDWLEWWKPMPMTPPAYFSAAWMILVAKPTSSSKIHCGFHGSRVTRRPAARPVPVIAGTGFGGYGYGSSREYPRETRDDH
ncbi:hypothetical protein FB45DRAFT_868276 [Roridomyces roridus]|uniref:Uncharacterized protein n=1 Tax=Roridomyces roridus TaxID=1738132 RepID=A0AAD7BQ59_9AGAR|nr:hypothetical protein FB45DRAFT_868276 [Roridomyces roridus]